MPEVQDNLACYLIVNGPLGMSAGKIATQAFQRLQEACAADRCGEDERATLRFWKTNGTRTITRIAETPGRIRTRLPCTARPPPGRSEGREDRGRAGGCPADGRSRSSRTGTRA